MKLISYNLEKHRAAGELLTLVRSTGAAAVCIQEARVGELPSSLEGLKLVAATPQNRLGLAIYADTERYEIANSFRRGFQKTLHDRIAAPAAHRLLGVVLRDRESRELSTLASFHASPLTSLNSHRRRQIAESLTAIEALTPSAPMLMVGDYNYPIFRSGLSRSLAASGYALTFSDVGTYERSLVRGHFDFVTSRGYSVASVRTLPKGASDHRPILIEAERSVVASPLLVRTAESIVSEGNPVGE